MHECAHLCAHTETRLVPLAVSLDSYFSNCTWCRFTYLPMHHIHHTHTHTHTYTHMHTSTHMRTNTQSELVPGWVLICFYTVYMCMNVHTHTHDTYWACITCSDLGFLFLTQSQSPCVCMCVCVCECVCTQVCRYIHAHVRFVKTV